MNAPHELDDLGVRVPPAAIEMEQSVLGALLLDNDAIDRLGDLRAEHFYRYEHRLIFETIQKMVMAARSADVMTVFEWMQSAGTLDRAGGLPYLNALAGNVPGSANIARYAQIVVDRWKLRGVLAALDEVGAMVHNRNGREVDEIIAEAQTRLESLADAAVQAPQLAAASLAELVTELDAQFHGEPSRATIVQTGFTDVDQKLDGGMRGGDLVVVAGRPSMGKTAFSMGIADHVAGHVGPTLVFSMEMPTTQLNMRLLARAGNLPIAKLKDGSKMVDGDWPHLTRAVEHMTDLPQYVDESGSVSLPDIVSRARALKRREGLSLIVVDYLGLVKLGKEERHDLQIAAVTRGLKELAKQLDVPVVLLCQLSRGVENRPNKRPQMSDLRDSGAIEQDADVILFLYRDEVYNPDTADKGVAEVIFAKQRNGSLGKVGLAFFGDRAKFADLDAGRLFGGHEPKPARARGFD
ncbi:replicative DNA helicase [Paraburkholderia lycopersici]|uniref:Replicative DNA helicase n=1 Tax=Paraburkholderia lycopersici TaxID=416944 RepID=A0A1G6K3B1_9BURK|nr:replicative DNA helicase [Paraburkholderia lycopersici]SDC25519.1 replicative DNA helicase [Paraburkholderia lycopersici]